MSHDNGHNHESPKRVYFGIPIAFALSFWFIVFLSLKACDGGSRHKGGCGEACSKECMEKCKAEGKDCAKTCGDGEESKGKESEGEESKDENKMGGISGENKTMNDSTKEKLDLKGEKSPTEKYDSAKAH